MGIFNWFDSGKTVVKTVKGNYTGKPLDITVDYIRKKMEGSDVASNKGGYCCQC